MPKTLKNFADSEEGKGVPQPTAGEELCPVPRR